MNGSSIIFIILLIFILLLILSTANNNNWNGGHGAYNINIRCGRGGVLEEEEEIAAGNVCGAYNATNYNHAQEIAHDAQAWNESVAYPG